MAEARSRQAVTADCLIRFITNLCGIYGGKSETVTVFLRSTSVFLSRYPSTDALYSYFIRLPSALYVLNLAVYGVVKKMPLPYFSQNFTLVNITVGSNACTLIFLPGVG